MSSRVLGFPVSTRSQPKRGGPGMKRISAGIIFFSLAFFLCAFTNSNMVSFKDPDFVGKIYNKILIVVNISDSDFKDQLEKTIQNKLSKKGVESLTSMKVLPPIRKFSDEEIPDILNRNKIQGVLVTNILSYEEDEKDFKPSALMSTGTTYSYTNLFHTDSRPRIISGYNVQNLNIQCHFDFVDVNSGILAWIAESKTNASGIFYTNQKSIVNYVSDTIVNRLFEDQIVK
jgi:hypothetical protein